MTREDLASRVLAWLLERGASGWIEAGGPSRLELCEQWRNVAAEHGAESPAALGCLLALVREAHAEPSIYACTMVAAKVLDGRVVDDGVEWIVTWGIVAVGCIARANTEALALVAALEVAPR